MVTIDYEALLIPVSIVLVWIVVGIIWAKWKKSGVTKEEIKPIKEALEIILERLPDGVESLARSAKSLGEWIGDLLVEKGPGVGAGLVFRDPEMQKVVVIVVQALLTYFNDHHEEFTDFMDDFEEVYEAEKEKPTIRDLKITFGGKT